MTRIAFIILPLFLSLPLAADPENEQGAIVIDKYRQALVHQQETQKNLSMEVKMEGRIPRLNKEGTMNALRKISSLGKITYKVLGFSGDDTVKKEVMARYMTAEIEAASKQPGPADAEKSIAITPENYQFKYKGVRQNGDKDVHVFELKPKHKRVGLFKGELWVDPTTYLPVHEGGRLVKNPSVFVKKMEFTRDYEIRDGAAYLKRMETKTDTRIVGPAVLNIDYANVQPGGDSVADDSVANLRSQ